MRAIQTFAFISYLTTFHIVHRLNSPMHDHWQ